MQIDRYTKFVLTIIAAALTALAVQGAVHPASAQMGDGCGSLRNPCYVTQGIADVLTVRVQ